MDYPRPCGCKGCRTCLLCESQFDIQEKGFFKQFQKKDSYVFCPLCNAIYPGWDVDTVMGQHPLHDGLKGTPFDGVYIELDFLSTTEEETLMKGIDEMPWQDSQSGRRKQNFGPKTNFKKMKLAMGSFQGFPSFSEFVQAKFKERPILCDFQSIEQCSLEYDSTKGASIDPHIDDCWVWGERVVTVNCLSDSVLTLSMYAGDPKRYNLPLVETYRDRLLSDLLDAQTLGLFANAIIRLPMPNRSLMVLYGAPRYQWEHCVLREDIVGRRVCVAYREFTPPYLVEDAARATLQADEWVKGHKVLEKSRVFWDHTQFNETSVRAS